MLAIREENGITVIGFEPMYDALDDAAMAATSMAMLEATQSRPPLVLCDFSQTKYFGSAFIEILARAWQRLRARGGHMVLCGLQPFCHKVLTVASLDEIWDIVDSRDEAEATLRAHGSA
jgi:anti-anti-sigma factor